LRSALREKKNIAKQVSLGRGKFGEVYQFIFKVGHCPTFLSANRKHGGAPPTVAVKACDYLYPSNTSHGEFTDRVRKAVQARFEAEMLKTLDHRCILKYFGSWIVRLFQNFKSVCQPGFSPLAL
jgi:hypothetical protein